MAVQPIVKYGDPVLREICRKLDFDEDADLIAEVAQDLLDTLKANKGAGLAAPQIGIPIRMLVLDHSIARSGSLADTVLINPVILNLGDGQTQDTEGCLSIPGYRETVTRWAYCEVGYLTLEGKQHKVAGFAVGSRQLSRCLQHELDHLDGRLIIDHLAPERRKVVERQLLRKLRKAA